MERIGARWWMMLLLLALAFPLPAVAPQDSLERLKDFGISADAGQLAAFLANGFPDSTDYSKLPDKPSHRCQLLIDAMQVAGSQRLSETRAPIEKLAQAQFAPGIQNMLQHDLLLAQPGERPAQQEELTGFLQYNAAVALALIGDAQSLPVLKKLYDQTQDAAPKVQYALDLTCVGDGEGLDFLVGEATKANQLSSVAAAQSLYYVAGIDWGYRTTSPVQLRKKLAADYAHWWKQTKVNFQIVPAAIIRRRLEPAVQPQLAMNNVRDLVALATNYADFTDQSGSRTADAKLESLGTSIAPDLEKIALDPMEDLVVRESAINRYTLLLKKGARKILKRLQSDENPEIVAVARKNLQAIDSGAIQHYSAKTVVDVNGQTKNSSAAKPKPQGK